MKVMSMALVIASVMSISAITVSATEYNNEKYPDRPKSTYYYQEKAPEANYERPPASTFKVGDPVYNIYTDDGRFVVRTSKETDYVQDKEKNIGYWLHYFDDGDVIKVMDDTYPGWGKKRYILDPGYMPVADYSERPDDIRMGDFIVGIGKYVDSIYIKRDGNDELLGDKREFKSKFIAKKYVGKGGIVTIPEGIEALAPNIFKDNKTITKVIGPKSLMYIGKDCFLNTDVTHFVFHSDYIRFDETSINFKGKTVIEFYTDASKIQISRTFFENYSGIFNIREYNSKSNPVIYCYGDRKGSVLDIIGLKAIYTKKIAYP